MAFNTVVLLGDLWERSEESRAGGTITPGMLLGNTTTALTQPGERPRVVAHATAGGPAEKKFAKEAGAFVGGVMASDGQSISGGTIDDNYSTGDLVFIHHAQPGDEIYAIVAASAAAITLADYLTSDGAGGVKKASGSDTRIAVPLEALDNSSVTTTARLPIRIL